MANTRRKVESTYKGSVECLRTKQLFLRDAQGTSSCARHETAAASFVSGLNHLGTSQLGLEGRRATLVTPAIVARVQQGGAEPFCTGATAVASVWFRLACCDAAWYCTVYNEMTTTAIHREGVVESLCVFRWSTGRLPTGSTVRDETRSRTVEHGTETLLFL